MSTATAAPPLAPPVELSPAEAELVAATARLIARPTVAPPDSFALHAPLELGARHDLLARITPAARPAALGRIEELRDAYALWDAIEEPGVGATAGPIDPAAVAAELVRAIGSADAEAADRAAHTLATHLEPAAIAPLVADAVLPALTAAGHGVIALDRLARCPADDPIGATGLRMLAREAARAPDWRITWHRESPEAVATGAPAGGEDDLARALAAPPRPGELASDFIYPMVDLVQRTGAAAGALAAPLRGLSVDRAGPVILRTAAASMVHDDPAKAPYGWSHCLTLPLGALGVASSASRPADAVAVAATYAFAFRATLGVEAVDPFAPAPPDADGIGWTALCDAAATHHDAHLVKYTLACVHAAQRDPEGAPWYRAAAAALVSWWSLDHPR